MGVYVGLSRTNRSKPVH